MKRRYYERFQVEDVINFFSGQLLQAKSPDGAQVFLQSIKITHRPLPSHYQEALRKLQHPHLAPIIDVMEEEDQIILVHPPFSGDPLPLVVNKERPMVPDVAIRVLHKCFKTLQDLNRLPLPLGATLDPKNILLNDYKPLILFYYMKKEAKQGHKDEKWRDLLYYLLTGQAPSGGIKACQKELESKNVPHRIARLALECLDRKYTFDHIAKRVDEYVSSKVTEGYHLSRRSKKKKYKGVAIAVSVSAAALVLISITVAQWNPTDGNASNNNLPFANVFSSNLVDQGAQQDEHELLQTITFNKTQNLYTLPSALQMDTSLRGEFQLQKLNGFVGYVETADQSSTYGFYIDDKGKIIQFTKIGKKYETIGDSGDSYKVKPGKKYIFELFYLPGEPIRISINEEGKSEKWMSVGTSPMNGDLKMRFRGNDGATLYYPQLSPITDRQLVDSVWMNQQPWRIDFGQAILDLDQNHLMYLRVYPKTQIRLNSNAKYQFQFSPLKDHTPFQFDLQAIDNTRYRFIWDPKERKMMLVKIDGSSETVAEQSIPWELKAKDRIYASISTNYKQLKIELKRGSERLELAYDHVEPVSIRDVTIRDENGFELIQTNHNRSRN